MNVVTITVSQFTNERIFPVHSAVGIEISSTSTVSLSSTHMKFPEQTELNETF